MAQLKVHLDLHGALAMGVSYILPLLSKLLYKVDALYHYSALETNQKLGWVIILLQWLENFNTSQPQRPMALVLWHL